MAAHESLIQLSKGYEKVNEFYKANLDALILSNTVLAKGLVELSKELVSLTQSSVQQAVEVRQGLTGAKSVKDGIELASQSAKANYEKLVENATKVTELSNKIAKDALAPVAARIDAVLSQVGSKAA